MLVIFDAQMTLFTTKQKDGESIQDYTKQFWISRKVFKIHIGGPIKLSKVLLVNQRYTKFASTIVEHKKKNLLEAYEQYLVFINNNNAEKLCYYHVEKSNP